MKTITFTYEAGATTTNEVTVKDFSVEWEQVLWDDDELSITGKRRNNIRGYKPTITIAFEHNDQLRTVAKEIYDTLQDGEVFIDGDGYYLSVVPDDFESIHRWTNQVQRKPSTMVLKGDLVRGGRTEIPQFLEPGPNFQVIVDPGDPTFSDDTFYIIDDKQSGSPRYYLRKCTIDNTSGIQISNSYAFDYNFYQTCVLRNGNIACLGYDTGPDEGIIQVLDSDLTLVNTARVGVAFNESPERIFIDYDDSIYIVFVTDSGGTPVHNVKKYNSDLTTTHWTYTHPVNSRFFVGGNVTKNLFVLITTDGTNNDDVRFINKDTGVEDDNFTRAGRTGAVDAGGVINFKNGDFITIHSYGSGEPWWKYDQDGTEIDSGTLDDATYSINITSRVREVTPLGDQRIILANQNNGISIFDSSVSLIRELNNIHSSSNSAGKIGFTTDSDKIFLHTRNTSTDSGSIVYTDLVSGDVYTRTLSTDADIKTNSNFGFGMPVENPNVQAPVNVGTPSITNVVLSASPSTATVPFTSTITFGADNTGDAGVTLVLTLDNSPISSLTIPAGGSESTTFDQDFYNPGTYEVGFAGDTVTITANGDTVSGGSEGWIDINSAAQDDVTKVQPEASVYVINTPSTATDCVSDPKFNVEWKLTDYCISLPDTDEVTVATAVSGAISSSVTGLGSTYPGLSPEGNPRIRVYSDTYGTADNGERVIFGVPSSVEGNGGVFNKYEVFLSGGVDELIVNATTDILIGGSVFATTSSVTALETESSIATKIYDACVAVGSGTYTFAKNGTRILVGSTAGAESLDLDIGNAGFNYSTQDIQ